MRLFLFLVMLLSTNVVFADNFDLYTSKTLINSCELSENVHDILTVVNNEQRPVSYRIELSGEAAQWSIVSPNEFTLLPNGIQKINQYNRAPEGTKGKFELITIIKNDIGLQKALKQVINVDKCVNIELISDYSKVKGCAGSYVEIPLTLKNVGLFDEIYEFSSSYDGNFTKNDVNLSQNTSLQNSLNFRLPNDKVGNDTLVIEAKAKSSKLLSRIKLPLEIEPCYDFEVSLRNSYDFCNGKKIDIPVTINNIGQADNYYNIDVKKVNWLGLEKDKIFVKSGEENTFNLSIYTDKNIDVNTTISIESSYGEYLANRTIFLKTQDCYNLNIEAPRKINACSCDEIKFPVKVKNEGIKEDNFILQIISPRYSDLNYEKEILLSQGNQLTFNLDFTVPCNAIGTSEIKLNLDDSNQNNSLINVYSQQKCRQIEFYVPRQRFDPEESKIGNVTIKNTGIKEGVYSVEAFPDDVIFFTKRTVQLAPGEVKILPFRILKENKSMHSVLFRAKSLQDDVVYDQQIFFTIYKVTKNKVFYWLLILFGIILSILLLPFIYKQIRAKHKKDNNFFKRVFSYALVLFVLGLIVYGIYKLIKKIGIVNIKNGLAIFYSKLLPILSKAWVYFKLGLMKFLGVIKVAISHIWDFLKIYGVYLIAGIVLLVVLIYLYEKLSKLKKKPTRGGKMEAKVEKKSMFDHVLNFFFEVELVEEKSEIEVPKKSEEELTKKKIEPKKSEVTKKIEEPKSEEVKLTEKKVDPKKSESIEKSVKPVKKKTTKKSAKKDLPKPWSKVQKYKKVNKEKS